MHVLAAIHENKKVEMASSFSTAHENKTIEMGCARNSTPKQLNKTKEDTPFCVQRFMKTKQLKWTVQEIPHLNKRRQSFFCTTTRENKTVGMGYCNKFRT